MKKFILLLMSLMLCAQAFALSLEAPSNILVNEAETLFEVTIANQSTETKELSFDFFSPVAFEAIGVPAQMGPNSTATIVIKLNHDSDFIGQVYSSPLEIGLGNEKITKEIKLKFTELEPVPQEDETNEGPEAEGPEDEGLPLETDDDENVFGINVLSGLVSLFVLTPETAELMLDIVLVVVAAVLLVAFISRFLKRIEARSMK